jgi:AcrR family transcriptional regulator
VARERVERTVKKRGAGDEAWTTAAGQTDRRKLKGEQSRERILDSATQLFSERGYAATGVNDIARGAGVEKAALYWHFESKAELLAAVLDRMDLEVVERIVKKVSARINPDERLDLFLDGIKKLAKERSHLVRLTMSVAIERSAISPESRAALQRIFERTRVAVEEGFAEALGVQLPDLDLIARLTLGYLMEASIRQTVDPENAQHDRFFAHLRRLIVLEVQHQLRTHALKVDPKRIPTL